MSGFKSLQELKDYIAEHGNRVQFIDETYKGEVTIRGEEVTIQTDWTKAPGGHSSFLCLTSPSRLKPL